MHSVRLTEWLNANSSRAFPLVTSGSLPQDVLVDARIILLKEQPANVVLTGLSTDGSQISLVFGCAGVQYTVASLLTGSRYQRITSDSEEAVFHITVGPGAASILSWSGSLQVEPACVLFPRLVRFIGALDGIPVDPSNPDTEMEVFGSITEGSAFIPPDRPYMMTGDIKIEGGYGFQVSVTGNTIIIAAVPGYGDRVGYPCFRVHERASIGNAIAYINGIPPDSFGNIDVEVGDGIRVAPVKDGGVSYLYITSPVSPAKARCKKV